MRRLVLPLTAGAVLCVIILSSTPAPAVAQVVPGDVQQAALAGDWNKVWTILGAEKTNPEPAELRLIKGHACLALNYNNQSLELFASALNDVDRTAWQQWADAFAEAHPASAIAWYFKGDALARQKQWKSPEKDAEKAKESPGADECFAEAIRLDPNCYLAFNACGVVAHAVGNTLTARHYFLKATKAKSDFVEGYASRGALNVYRNSVKAEQDFAEARRHAKKNEEPVLLSIGDGCVAYGRQQYAKARAIFAGAEIPKCLAALAGRNLAATELANLAFTADRTAHPGFSLQAALLHEEQQPPPPDKAAQPSDDEIESLIDRVESQDSKTIIVHTGGRLYCRRWISRHTPTCRWTAYRELPSLYRSADTPPAKPQSGTQFPVELLPNIPFLRISHSGKEAEVAEEFVQAAGVLMRLTAQIAQESRARPTAVPAEAPSVVVVPVAPADEPTMQKLGGAESDPRKVPVDYGRWGVCSVYGLLYAMPERAPKPQGPKG